jgi:hypothetical protein
MQASKQVPIFCDGTRTTCRLQKQVPIFCDGIRTTCRPQKRFRSSVMEEKQPTGLKQVPIFCDGTRTI